MITVIGANILHEFDVSGCVVARTQRSLDAASMAGLNIQISHAYDAAFDRPPAEALEIVVNDLLERSRDDGLLYVLPEDGVPGDATVEAVSQRTDITIIPGGSGGVLAGIGNVHIVDALDVALAEEQGPFDRGLCPMDPTVPHLITNWYGQGVIGPATRRLARVYDASVSELESWDVGGRLVVPPLDMLDGPGSLYALEHIVARLRRPDGCPWDREQTRESLFPQFVEELEELGEAISARDIANQCEELGDVLFHVIAQCQLAGEAGDFTLDDVLRGINTKLVRRHPHVFADVQVDSYDEVLATWNRVKAEEKASRLLPKDVRNSIEE